MAAAAPRTHRRRRRSGTRIAASVVTHAILIALALFSIAPLLWAVSNAFKPNAEILSTTALLPHHLTLANFRAVVADTDFPRWFWNSLLVAVSTTALAIVVGSLGGYAMSRWRFYGRGLYGNSLLVIQMFPGVMLGIPLYLLLSDYHLINTLWALIVTYLTFSLAFAVWMLKGYFDSIPRSIEEAAIIDGANRYHILRHVILPLSGPGITTVAVFAFLLAWNEFFFAYLFLADSRKFTLVVGLYTFIQQFSTSWGNIMAAGVLTTLPVLVFFFLLQRTLTRGLVGGAVKG
jgi:arabinogalactan oligomer / maltooligosaccharide transport system permease protein